MFDMFTMPPGKETIWGKIIGILAGVFVASGFYVISDRMELFNPGLSAILAVFFFVIVTYQVRKKLVVPDEEQSDENIETFDPSE